MMKSPIPFRRASAEGAVAAGARATGSAATGALAVGALAVGAAAIGALAIGRLVIGRAKLDRVEIGELVIGRMSIGGEAVTAPLTVTRIRAAPGRGDAMERLLIDHMQGTGLLRRSSDDPDLFFHEHQAAPSGSDHDPHDEWLATLRTRIAAEELAKGSVEDTVTVERLHTVTPPTDASALAG